MNELHLDTLEIGLNCWLKSQPGLENINVSVMQPLDRDATILQLATTVYARQEISGLAMSKMASKAQVVNWAENSSRAMLYQMAKVCRDMADSMERGAR